MIIYKIADNEKQARWNHTYVNGVTADNIKDIINYKMSEKDVKDLIAKNNGIEVSVGIIGKEKEIDNIITDLMFLEFMGFRFTKKKYWNNDVELLIDNNILFNFVSAGKVGIQTADAINEVLSRHTINDRPKFVLFNTANDVDNFNEDLKKVAI